MAKSISVLRHPWIINILFWFFLTVILIARKAVTVSLGEGHVIWYNYISYIASGHIAWALLTIPTIRFINRRKHNNIIFVLIVSLILALLVTTLAVVFDSIAVIANINNYRLDTLLLSYAYSFLLSLIDNWIIAIVLLAGTIGWKIYKSLEQQRLENAQLETSLMSTRLQVLRNQLNPHFIFNAFNTISMMIRTKEYSNANDMLVKVSGFLRKSIYQNETTYTTLEEEFNNCREYLDVEKVRFRDRVDISFELHPQLRTFLVPAMILQPLIENVFKHGIMNNLSEQFKIIITANKTGKAVHITVANTGEIVRHPGREGIGIKNIQEQLTILYKGKASFTLSEKDRMTIAMIQIKI